MEEPFLADLIGVPYKENGRDLKGLDCYGLAIEVCKRYGKTLKDVYYNNHDIELADKYAPTLNVRKTDEIKAGCLLEMTFLNELHIGVVINKKEFIHATKNGVQINNIRNAPIINIYEVI